AGGKPGQFYGTEIDLRAQWRFLEHFAADLEGAILFPGDALQDENGDAARSILIQGRSTVFF
ncbi:MAG: alginate export family protein, partial [Myxococcales bacterium]|nr:alginate export family protein [Myxococcales bacterium]